MRKLDKIPTMSEPHDFHSDHSDFSPGFEQIRRKFWNETEIEEALLMYDLECAQAHVRMLGETEIADKQAAKSVIEALERMKNEVAEGKSYVGPEDVDIHAGMERRLQELVGDASAIVRIAKSRNDQIATDIRMWLRDALTEIFDGLIETRRLLLALGKRDIDVVMPGYTHMQPAQPILLSHWWLANEARFRRDFDRLVEFYKRLNVLPLGANVLAGTVEPIDRKMVARFLEFDDVIENSLDAVSDRDYVIEFAAVASLFGVHVSQMSADLLLWATQEFGFVKLQKRFVVRTQRLPYKRNPELLEILRSRPSLFYARLIEFISELKALPSGYSQDLQECLPGLFEMVSNLKFILDLVAALLGGLDIDAKRMRAVACSDLMNWSNAVAYLTSKGVEDERAQKVLENLSHYCKTRNKFLSDLSLSEWQQFSPVFDHDVYEHVTMEESVGAYCSFGGSSKDQVEVALNRSSEALQADLKRIPGRSK
ncbi:MAG TPA: argininosuccinate lyase, partial [Candidatus Obscuribacterales bacterium]